MQKLVFFQPERIAGIIPFEINTAPTCKQYIL